MFGSYVWIKASRLAWSETYSGSYLLFHELISNHPNQNLYPHPADPHAADMPSNISCSLQMTSSVRHFASGWHSACAHRKLVPLMAY